MTDTMENWKQKDVWTRRAKDFCVEVVRHTKQCDHRDNTGFHRWCVYAYIYPTHPHFAKFSGNGMWQDAAVALPLHGGPSMLRWHRDDTGNPLSVQVGADYSHCGDERYTHCEDQEQAYSVFRDADDLYAWLELSDED